MKSLVEDAGAARRSPRRLCSAHVRKEWHPPSRCRCGCRTVANGPVPVVVARRREGDEGSVQPEQNNFAVQSLWVMWTATDPDRNGFDRKIITAIHQTHNGGNASGRDGSRLRRLPRCRKNRFRSFTVSIGLDEFVAVVTMSKIGKTSYCIQCAPKRFGRGRSPRETESQIASVMRYLVVIYCL